MIKPHFVIKRIHQCAVRSTYYRHHSLVTCPGQGLQYVGMLQHMKRDDHINRMLEVADGILGYDLMKLCRNGPKEVLGRTLYCQPAVVIAAILGFQVLKNKKKSEENIKNFDAAFVAGYSVGEISALCIANWIDFDAGVQLVKVRASAMDRASNITPSGMLFMQGLTFDEASEMCEEVSASLCDSKHSITVVSQQYPKAVTLGGSHVMLKKVMNREHALLTDQSHVKLSKVDGSGAFHTTYMQPAQEEFNAVLSNITITPNESVVYSNVTGKPYSNNDNISDLLVRQIAEPVLMYPILQNIQERYQQGEIQSLYEVGPGKQWKALFRKVDSKLSKAIENISM